MIAQLIYIAVGLYFQKRNPELGLKILIERWPYDQFPPELLLWWRSQRSLIEEQCQTYAQKKINFTYPGCWDYPNAFLKNLERPPLLLTYMGKPSWNNVPNLAAVGSRKIAPESQEWIHTYLLKFLTENSLNIISGGARGVDQASHLCALRAKRSTFLFLPSGLNHLYPKDLWEWQEAVLDSGGAFVSEFWPNEPIQKHHFVSRNRLIAAISDAVLVIQGEVRSGTMLTARWALDLGRELGTLPGHPMESQFSGNLELIRLGVSPIIDDFDLKVLLTSGISSRGQCY